MSYSPEGEVLVPLNNMASGGNRIPPREQSRNFPRGGEERGPSNGVIFGVTVIELIFLAAMFAAFSVTIWQLTVQNHNKTENKDDTRIWQDCNVPLFVIYQDLQRNATPTATVSPSTSVIVVTASVTPSASEVSQTKTPTNTPSQTGTPSNTPSNTGTPSNTPSNTGTPSNTPSNTGTPTNTPTGTGSGTGTPTPSNTPTSTGTPTNTPTSTSTGTGSGTPTPSNTPSNSATGTGTPSNTPSNTGTPSNTPSNTGTPSNTPSNTGTSSNSPTGTPTSSNSPTGTGTPSTTSTASASSTPSNTPSRTPSNSPTTTISSSSTPSNTPSPSTTKTISATPTPSSTPSAAPGSCSNPSTRQVLEPAANQIVNINNAFKMVVCGNFDDGEHLQIEADDNCVTNPSTFTFPGEIVFPALCDVDITSAQGCPGCCGGAYPYPTVCDFSDVPCTDGCIDNSVCGVVQTIRNSCYATVTFTGLTSNLTVTSSPFRFFNGGGCVNC